MKICGGEKRTPQRDAFWKLYHPGDSEHIQDGWKPWVDGKVLLELMKICFVMYGNDVTKHIRPGKCEYKF